MAAAVVQGAHASRQPLALLRDRKVFLEAEIAKAMDVKNFESVSCKYS